MEKIGAALLSFGMSGRVFHAPFLDLHSGFELLGSWERSSKKIEEAYPGVKSYESLEAVLDDPEVTLVVVNTPTYTHYDYARKALEAGKHIIVEKAFVSTTKEARDLAALAQDKGLHIGVFQNRRFDSDFRTVKSVLDKGLIGEVVEASIAFHRYKAELSPKTHKEIPSAGAGIIKDLGAHVIDQALALFGLPKSVFADIGITRPDSQVDDYFDILLRYEGDLRVHVKGGYYFREPTPEFAFYGRKGTFLKSRSDVQEDQLQAGMKPDDPAYGLESDDDKGLLHTEVEGEIIKENIPTLPGDYKAYYAEVYAALTGKGKMPVTAEDGIQVMQVIDAAFLSAKEGKVIPLDLES
ncbi:Gfo/Idh/MocA family oxidoreductase [Marinoscillum furvescens]|uniref:Putative dehydrogenase n=1 Tax=Marinoscillum furvescens DSM 4134 TaxID=1122208 RepID=A0A3D9L3P6_MARFU|nr:Gfo/Idh/MocA family oxidoreductase [Marinoscillum furvescens]RED99820.1 putative dehydrogenase [Marinoscillum furvescens DSM 4134]